MKTTRYRFFYLTAWDKNADLVQDFIDCPMQVVKKDDVFAKVVDWIELN